MPFSIYFWVTKTGLEHINIIRGVIEMDYAQAHRILTQLNTIPYPKPVNVMKNIRYANLLLDDYASSTGELTAITMYIYQHISFEDGELGNIMREIAIVEMKHLDLVGDLILRLGGDPKYVNSRGVNWNSECIDYKKQPIIEVMKSNIRAEQEAIYGYEIAKKYTRNSSVRALFDRIIMDEKGHIEIFRGIQSNLINLNTTI